MSYWEDGYGLLTWPLLPIAQRQHVKVRPQLPHGHGLSSLHMGGKHEHLARQIGVKMGLHKFCSNFQCISTLLPDGQEWITTDMVTSAACQPSTVKTVNRH